MKVCMLTTGFPRFAGDLFGSFVMELARELAAEGLDLEVVAPHQAGLKRCETSAGVRIRRFRYLFPTRWQLVAYGGGIPTNLKQSWVARVQVPFFLLGFFWRAFWQCRHSDLVHCHWTICGLVGYLATRWRRQPLVLSVRGSDIHLMEKGWMRWLNNKIYGWMDVIISVSADIADKLEKAGVDKSKIRVVYNGVDSRFRVLDQQTMRRQLALPLPAFIVLFVGLLVPVKGVEILLQAVAHLGDARVFCVLVGEGPMRGELEVQARQAGIDSQILFAGQRPTHEIPAWINAADVVVLPSYSEGRPNVVVEAQACGVPVIATRVGGAPELINDGETGLLVDSGDPAQLALAITSLLEDGGKRRRLGQAGQAGIEAGDRSWGMSARRVKAIYMELAGAEKSTGDGKKCR